MMVMVGWRLAGETEVLRENKPATAPLCPTQIPLDVTQARTRAAAVGKQRLTAWAMARPRIALKSRRSKLESGTPTLITFPSVPPDERWYKLGPHFFHTGTVPCSHQLGTESDPVPINSVHMVTQRFLKFIFNVDPSELRFSGKNCMQIHFPNERYMYYLRFTHPHCTTLREQ
jgi:hypothetical protein